MAKLEPMDHIVRGILVGASVGAIVALTGLFGEINLYRGAGLGMIVGFLAGLTHARRVKNQQDRS